jgi:predicted DNA-binding ribbon-helix-helix protein
MEDPFWEGLREIAKTQRKTLSDLVGSIDTNREHGTLSSALRLFVLNHYQAQAASQPKDSRPSVIISARVALSRPHPLLRGIAALGYSSLDWGARRHKNGPRAGYAPGVRLVCELSL